MESPQGIWDSFTSKSATKPPSFLPSQLSNLLNRFPSSSGSARPNSDFSDYANCGCPRLNQLLAEFKFPANPPPSPALFMRSQTQNTLEESCEILEDMTLSEGILQANQQADSRFGEYAAAFTLSAGAVCVLTTIAAVILLFYCRRQGKCGWLISKRRPIATATSRLSNSTSGSYAVCNWSYNSMRPGSLSLNSRSAKTVLGGHTIDDFLFNRKPPFACIPAHGENCHRGENSNHPASKPADSARCQTYHSLKSQPFAIAESSKIVAETTPKVKVIGKSGIKNSTQERASGLQKTVRNYCSLSQKAELSSTNADGKHQLELPVESCHYLCSPITEVISSAEREILSVGFVTSQLYLHERESTYDDIRAFEYDVEDLHCMNIKQPPGKSITLASLARPEDVGSNSTISATSTSGIHTPSTCPGADLSRDPSQDNLQSSSAECSPTQLGDRKRIIIKSSLQNAHPKGQMMVSRVFHGSYSRDSNDENSDVDPHSSADVRPHKPLSGRESGYGTSGGGLSVFGTWSSPQRRQPAAGLSKNSEQASAAPSANWPPNEADATML